VSLIDGGIVAHNEALAVVLTEPTSGTALLVGEHNGSSGVRTAEDIVVSAGSSVHAVTDPTGRPRRCELPKPISAPPRPPAVSLAWDGCRTRPAISSTW
jgi:hypothetical protein